MAKAVYSSTVKSANSAAARSPMATASHIAVKHSGSNGEPNRRGWEVQFEPAKHPNFSNCLPTSVDDQITGEALGLPSSVAEDCMVFGQLVVAMQCCAQLPHTVPWLR